MTQEELIERDARWLYDESRPGLTSDWDKKDGVDKEYWREKATRHNSEVNVPARLVLLDENQDPPDWSHDVNWPEFQYAKADMVKAGWQKVVPLTKQGD